MLIDFIFAILLIIACIKGFRKGLIIAIFSIIAFIIGLAAALKLSLYISNYLKERISIPSNLLPLISFAFVFLIVVLLVNLGGKLIDKIFKLASLGWANKLSGMILYMVLYAIIFSIFLFYAEKIHLIQHTLIQSSKIYPFVQPFGPRVINELGTIIPAFKNMFADLENFFNALPGKISGT